MLLVLLIQNSKKLANEWNGNIRFRDISPEEKKNQTKEITLQNDGQRIWSFIKIVVL